MSSVSCHKNVRSSARGRRAPARTGEKARPEGVLVGPLEAVDALRIAPAHEVALLERAHVGDPAGLERVGRREAERRPILRQQMEDELERWAVVERVTTGG